MLQNLSFKRKIILLVGAAVVSLTALAAYSGHLIRSNLVEGRRASLTAAVLSAQSIAQAYQARAQSGAMPVEEAQKAAKEAIKVARFGEKTDYFYIWTMDHAGVMHPFKPEWDGQPMRGKVLDGAGNDVVASLVTAISASKDGRAFVPTMFPRPQQKELVPKLQYVVKVEGWNWIVGAGLYMDDVDAEVIEALLTFGGVTLAFLLVIGGVGFGVGRSVLRQIGGEPSEALAVMSQVSAGNLAVNMPHAPQGSLLNGIAGLVASVRETVTGVRRSTDSITTASSEIAAGNTDLSQRTEEAASSLQQTASSMEQLTTNVQQTAESARTANQLASTAQEAAARGGDVVAQVVSTMGDINASSKRIAEIIGVIDGIAFQTNILALNAAVEAARAGEQGRGFAVVAGEVRSLAQRSAEAAKEIKTLIGASVERVESGTQLVGHAGAAMQEIVSSVQRVTDIIGEITAAAVEQSKGIHEVNTAVTQLDQVTQQNAALVEESAAAAESLKAQAQQLFGTVQRFQLEAQAVR